MAAENEWTAVVTNLSLARAVWKRMIRILSREGAEPQVSVFLFKDMVQVVLIFIPDTWVVTVLMGSVLQGFQAQVERQLMGRLL